MKVVVVAAYVFLITGMLSGTVYSEAQAMQIHPVGAVVKDSGSEYIEILPSYRDALLGLKDFSHVIVFYWFDRNDTPKKRDTLRVHPRRNPENPLTGVFATRSPLRPNLIGFSVCKITSIIDGRIHVEKIDAFDKSPVIDLKPYIPANDCVPDASAAPWVARNIRK